MTDSQIPNTPPLEPATVAAGNGGHSASGATGSGTVERAVEERNWAMLCHLSTFAGLLVPVVGDIFAPLIVWAIKRNDHPLVDHHGKEALNFQISMTLYLAVALLFSFILIGIPFLLGLLLADLVLPIVAAVRAADGEEYRYPATIRLVR